LDWLDYREKLGIGFNDNKKTEMFVTNVLNVLGDIDYQGGCILTDKEYIRLCTMTGTSLINCVSNKDIIRELHRHVDNFIEFLSYCVAIINSKDKRATESVPRNQLIKCIENFLEKAHIQFEISYDENKNYFIFPKGAKELDDALVSEPLEWLKSYPKAHKTFCNALKQYSEGIYIRDVADNFRKALEEFLQEFLGNDKNLETNKTEICKYLGEQSVDSGISGLYQPLINSYKNINDRIAKHHDKIDAKLIEFLLYQTGVLIRMTITVKNAAK